MVPLPRLELGSVNLHPPTQEPPSGSSLSPNSDQVEEHWQAGHQVTDHHNFRCLLSPTNPHKLLSNSTVSPSTKCHSTSIPERISRRRSQGRQRPQRGRSLSATESAAARRLSSLSRCHCRSPSFPAFPPLCRLSSAVRRCSQTLSAAAAPAHAGFKLLLTRRKAAKRDAAHPSAPNPGRSH